MHKWFYVPLFAISGLLASSAFAEDGDSIIYSKPTLSISQEITRVVKAAGYDQGLTAGQGGDNKAWMEPTSGSLDFVIHKGDRMGLEVMLAATYFVAPYHYEQNQNFTRNFGISAPRLDASYIFGSDVSKPLLKLDFGAFTYKYNEYSRNLGEYMFRTWAYPGIIQTGGVTSYVGANGVTVTGLKVSQTLGMFSHDFIASLETEMNPYFDLNLTYMARVNLHNVLKVGGGIQLARVYSADDDPRMTYKYFERNGTAYAFGDDAGTLGHNYYGNLEKGSLDHIPRPGPTAQDTARFIADSTAVVAATQATTDLLDSVASGAVPVSFKEITAQSIKPLVYFSFDPKPMLGLDMFGAKDLVIYGEAALLGVKNYPIFYNSMMRRIPVMLGFNIPTFKLLDVFSVEVEYYRNRLLPTYPFPINLNGTPAPETLSSYYPEEWDKDNFKWSFSAERTFLHGITLSGQVASDHSRSWNWDAFGKVPWEMYTTPTQWYWGVKLGMKI